MSTFTSKAQLQMRPLRSPLPRKVVTDLSTNRSGLWRMRLSLSCATSNLTDLNSPLSSRTEKDIGPMTIEPLSAYMSLTMPSGDMDKGGNSETAFASCQQR
jgi:hypothetical protein